MIKKANRRSFLRACLGGGVVSVSLPVLECMLDQSGTAYADGAALETFFGIWFCGNGIAPSAWTPAGEGQNWSLPTTTDQRALLELLEPASGQAEAEPFYLYGPEQHAMSPLLSRGFKDKVSIVTGTKVPPDRDGGWVQHMAGQCCALSGEAAIDNPGVSLDDRTVFAGPTADQVMAELFGVRPLVVAMEYGDADAFTSAQSLTQKSVSWRRAKPYPELIEPLRSPLQAFQDVFGAEPGSGDLEKLRAANQSILDHIRPELSSLMSKSSAFDRQRLEQHFTSLREVEADLAQQVKLCGAVPLGLSDALDPNNIKAQHDAYLKVVALSLACGARRSFSLMFARPTSAVTIPPATFGMHGVDHVGFISDGLFTLDKLRQGIANQSPQDRAGRLSTMPLIRQTVVFEVDRYVDLLAELAATPFGASNLLDQSAVVATFEMWDGNHHGFEEHAILVGGAAGGRLKAAGHIRDTRTSNPAELTLSAMRAAAGPGVLLEGLGEPGNPYHASTGYPAIESA